MLFLVLVIGPSVAIMVYIYSKDKYDREPKVLLVKLFFFGVLTTLPAALVEGLAITDIKAIQESGNLVTIFLYSLLGVSLVEEGFKYLALRLGIRKSKYFNQMYDSIVYSVFVSLGFATIENILYILAYGGGSAIMRAITAVPGHAIFGVTMGYYLGMATFCYNKEKKKTYMTMSILMPVLLHGVYDFLLLSQHVLLILAFYPFMGWLYYIGMKKANILCKMDNYNRRLENQKKFHEENDYHHPNTPFGQYDPYHYNNPNGGPYTNYQRVNYNYLKNPNQQNIYPINSNQTISNQMNPYFRHPNQQNPNIKK